MVLGETVGFLLKGPRGIFLELELGNYFGTWEVYLVGV